MHHYCTLFDRNYLSRGLTLYRSLARHGRDFRLHVLCLDRETRESLSALALPDVELHSLAELEASDPALSAVRSQRSPAEYFFTCKPVLLAHLQAAHPDGRRFTYLDSDLYFFAPAHLVDEECADSSVAVAPHKFGSPNADRLKYGQFNAGWVSAGRSPEAREFVQWWRARCIEWCRMVVEGPRFADQKYLEQVPGRFPEARVVHHPGVNAGPWSLDASQVQLADGKVSINGAPLLIFHFHLLHRILPGVFESGLHEYGVKLTAAIRQGIYAPYLAEMARSAGTLGRVASDAEASRRPSLGRRLARSARAVARRSALFAAG